MFQNSRSHTLFLLHTTPYACRCGRVAFTTRFNRCIASAACRMAFLFLCCLASASSKQAQISTSRGGKAPPPFSRPCPHLPRSLVGGGVGWGGGSGWGGVCVLCAFSGGNTHTIHTHTLRRCRWRRRRVQSAPRMHANLSDV